MLCCLLPSCIDGMELQVSVTHHSAIIKTNFRTLAYYDHWKFSLFILFKYLNKIFKYLNK
jgi:hypothetical protein